jgi:transposase-like protein
LNGYGKNTPTYCYLLLAALAPFHSTLRAMSGTRTPRKQRAYSVREKRAAVRRIEEVGVEEVAREISCARGTVHGWWKQADKLFSFTGAATSKTLKGQGRKEMFPAVPALVTFMKDKRREEKVRTLNSILLFFSFTKGFFVW